MLVETIAPGLVCLGTPIANLYFVGTPPAPWAIVDSGIPGYAAQIGATAERLFGQMSRPVAILLTHGHFDHSGSALELARMWDVPIYAHALERPFLTGKSMYPPKDPTVGGAMAFLCRFFPSTPPYLAERLRDLPENCEVPGLPGWRWIHTPGHAPGHVAFFEEQGSRLLAGDACTTMDLDSPIGMLSQHRKISRPPAPFTFDWDQAHDSVRRLAELRPALIACGHGKPMSGGQVADQLSALAANFPRPSHGRYAGEPARTDQGGIASLPPSVPDPLPRIAAVTVVSALAVAVAGAVALSRRNAGRS
ncbi:MAG: MBL fold metallo-hydrolase [Bryobacteraceae bacterium]